MRYKSDFLRFKKINKWILGKEILDIGSREGFLHRLLLKYNKNKKIYTLDLDNADFNIDLNKKIDIIQKFDCIIAGEIIEHIENPIKFIKNCYKLLNKNGRLILSTPNSIGLQYFLNESWCIGERGHINCFTLPMIKKIIESENFKIISEEYVNAFWNNNPLQYISLIFKRLRPDLLIIADKNNLLYKIA